MNPKNIYKNIPSSINEEIFEIIDSTDDVKVERIISDGNSSPKDFWYDQEKNELVFLLQGSAVIEYKDGNKIEMNPGDYLIIPPHQLHRVNETSKEEKTIWLAIHY